MICTHCSKDTFVVETRDWLDSFHLRKRRYGCAHCGFRFNTVEMPEEVFNAHKKSLISRLRQFERGVEQRLKQMRTRTQIDSELKKGGKSYEEIALAVSCSKSLVEKHARETRILSSGEQTCTSSV
jgi:transcriptional regulator NrdR family protein